MGLFSAFGNAAAAPECARETDTDGELALDDGATGQTAIQHAGSHLMDRRNRRHAYITERQTSSPPLWRLGIGVAACLSAALGASWAQQEDVSLPNPGFEQGGGTVAAEVLSDAAVATRVPAGWTAMQWAPVSSKFEAVIEEGIGHRGTAAFAARNLDATARPGIYTRIHLPPGRYLLTFLARCEEGRRGLVRAYLGDAYLPLQRVGPAWGRVTCERSIRNDIADGEIRLQNCSRTVTTVYFEDVSLRRLPPASPDFLPDRRRRPPKTLLLSPITIEDLKRDAAAWAGRGFGGFLLSGIMDDLSVDVWGVDGDPATTGEDDARLQEVRACNAVCSAHEIDTFLYVPCATALPVWLDDEQWTDALESFQQAAVFAAQAHCKGIALDLQSMAPQSWPQWAGYDYRRYTKTALREAAYARGLQMARMAFGYRPTLELLLMPEGLLEYGPMYADLFQGLIEHAAEARYRGGIHLLAKDTFDVTNADDLLQYPASIDVAVMTLVNKAAQRYWQKHCSLALGCWPLGYARPITDASGAAVGWGGRAEIFGDEVVGEYADRGPRYPIEQFREQFGAAMTVGSKYVWIDAHGPTWWSDEPMADTAGMTREQIAKLRARHTVENIEEYHDIVRAHEVVKLRQSPSSALAPTDAEPSSSSHPS